MKKKSICFLLCAALLTGAASCNKVAPDSYVSSGPMGTLTVKVGVPVETKAAKNETKDFQINSLQIFVFDGTGDDARLETDKYVKDLDANGSTSQTINTLTGTKTVYTLVNHSRLYYMVGSNGKKMGEFEKDLTDLSENSVTNLVMSGKNQIDVVPANNNGAPKAPQEVKIYVQRLASRIELGKVVVDFTGTSLEGASFSITEIYLKNCVGKSPMGVNGLCDKPNAEQVDDRKARPLELDTGAFNDNLNWYNRGKKEDGSPDVLDDAGMEKNFTQVIADSTEVNHVLFTYPNRQEQDGTGEIFSPRHTRLVIKAHVKTPDSTSVDIDKDTYYVLTLPQLAANYAYLVNRVKITMLGKDNDDDDAIDEAGRLTPTVEVDGWTGEVELSYEH